MAELKTKRNKGDVDAFLNSVSDEKKRQDSFTILELMKQVISKKPEMWGNSIVGFGSYSYTNTTGRENTWFLTGFSPRKQILPVHQEDRRCGYRYAQKAGQTICRTYVKSQYGLSAFESNRKRLAEKPVFCFF